MTSVIRPDTKTAIVLFNLGGPDGLHAVEPFLYHLFSDPAIISLPGILRQYVAKKISKKRAPIAQEIYKNLGGASPLLSNTLAQSEALTKSLSSSGDVQIFICMRYWHPMGAEVVNRVKNYAPDHIILLPLYPQFSTTTTASSFADWDAQCKSQELDVPTTKICCYPSHPKFIAAQTELLQNTLAQAKDSACLRVLFSAHGLPEKIIRKGDPYQRQVEQTTHAIMSSLPDPKPEYVNCYQSRVGPLKWIGPSTEEEITRAGKEGYDIVLVPVAFVSEHSETLVELDIEYKELAMHAGVKRYLRVPTVSCHPEFIAALGEMCLAIKKQEKPCHIACGAACDMAYGKCYLRKEGCS